MTYSLRVYSSARCPRSKLVSAHFKLGAKAPPLSAAAKASDRNASFRLVQELIIDGSFVTAKPAPNDIDLIVLLHEGQDFERDLAMSEYALLSRTLLRRRFGFDVIIAEPDSSL